MSGSKKSILQQKKELDRKTLFFYGLADMPIQMAAIPVAAFIPNYYGQDLGLSIAAVGMIWLLTRLFDAVSDPLVGWLSGRSLDRLDHAFYTILCLGSRVIRGL